MQVNKVQAELISLHKAYNNCLKAKVTDWLAMDAASKQETYARGKIEFCVDEKKVYMNFMERNVPTEYNNILRLEEGNF